MKSCIATSLCLLAAQSHASEETSLMQGLVARRDTLLAPDAKDSRKAASTKLMETATKMMKNGATPDVLTFINETIWEIENVILQAIVDDHRRDQELIVASRNRFSQAITDMETCKAEIEEHADDLEDLMNGHKLCRSEEALACARSRKCEDELEELWLRVVREETEMRRIHWAIHGEWCVPPLPPHPGLADPWNWPDQDHYEGPETSESDHFYPEVNQGDDVIAFRTFTVDHFGSYIIQLPIVEEVWELYNRKLLECAAKEETWQLKVQDCDDIQDEMNDKACLHSAGSRQCASDWGHEYEMAMDEYGMLIGNGMYVDGENDMHEDLYNYLVGRGITVQRSPWGTTQCDVPGSPPLPECTALPLLEFERKREWESLSIVLCLLRTVYTHVIHSIDSGEPCPTTETHHDQTVAEINYCHTLDFAAAGTANLTLEWFEPPPPPDVPPFPHPPCTAEYIWETTGSFSAELIASHNDNLRIEGLEDYYTLISAFGWPGCAPAKVCRECESEELIIDPDYVENSLCKEHHSHLHPGQMDRDTFKCMSGTQCVLAIGRCNEVDNCDDGSDERGCDTPWGSPAVLHQEECRDPFVDELQFRCADNVHCTHIFGKCNGINNCADGSDEVGCATTTHGATLEATSGYTATIVTPEIHQHIFSDREYTIDSLGSFEGHSFIHMSNEDKHTVNGKIQMKVRLPRPTVIYVVMLDSYTLPWLELEGWTETRLEGISYHGVRQTRHTDWSGELHDDHYEAGKVYQKTFSAGTVLLRGNNGGDGSFVMFMANPGNTPQPPHCPNCLPGHDTYIGCFTDNSARDLGPMVGTRENSATNTYELCRAECLSRLSLYMSLQWGGECFCADEYATADEYYQVDDSNCNVVREPCSPNSHNCGGTWHQAIYQIMDDAEPSGAPEGWQAAHTNWNCAGTGGSGRDSAHTVTTNEACAHECYAEGFPIAAFWHNDRNICRCYESCPGGGPTVMPEYPNLVMEKVYHMASIDKKCPHNHGDRLFRSPASGSSSITLDECYRECQDTPTCAHFSHGYHDGGYVCMGCTTLENEQTHVGFRTYDMERSTPPVEMIANWDFEGMTTDGQVDTLAEGKWIHFSNNGNSGLTNPMISNWQCHGGCPNNGLFNPPSNDVAEGTHVLFLNRGDDSNYVYQDLLHPFNWDIHIEAAVGGGNNNNDGGYRMQLWSGDNLVKEVAAGENGAQDTGTVSVREYVRTYLTLTTAEAPDYVGQPMQLRLKKNKNGQGHYHYIRFT